MNEIKSKIRAFMAENFDSARVQDDDDIFALGFVNSLFAMRLVLFVEDNFQITIENEELDLDNFRSVNRIAAFVERKSE